MAETGSSGDCQERRLVGYLCPSYPDGPLIPPGALCDPCGDDRAVYSDGTIEPAPNSGRTEG